DTSTSIVGSLQYASPELFGSDGHGVFLTAVDIWAFGITTYALIIGDLPFQHSLQPKLRMMILEGSWNKDAFRRARGAADAVEPALELMKGCLDMDVDVRWNVRTVVDCE